MIRPDFIIIPEPLLSDPKIQSLDEKVYGYIYWFEKLKDGICRASNETLAELAYAKVDSVRHSLGRLEARGYIKRHYADEEKLVRESIECLVTYGRKDPGSGSPGGGSVEPGGGGSVEPQKKNSNNKRIVSTKVDTMAAPAEREDKRDPDINEVVEKFQSAMQLTLTRMPYQRRAAKTLISQHGLVATLRVIDAVVAARHEQYSPVILSLEDLRDKWPRLAAFYERKKNESKMVDLR